MRLVFKDRTNVDNANIQFIIRVRNNLQSSNAKTEVDVKDMVMVALMYIGEDDDKERGRYGNYSFVMLRLYL